MVREPGTGQVHPVVTVAVPTLAADSALDECLASLERQTFSDFEVIVIDNSGRQAVVPRGRVRVIANKSNVGFGAAVNQAFHESAAPFLAVLNDDAVAHPGWLKALLDAVEERPDVGMCASQVRLAGVDLLDSAGMLLARDGSSKQRGHREASNAYARLEEALLPSGSAALYRREMLEEIGLFDESFFLYCEDTDLGLRARWAGWECLYAPGAVVEHRYSHSAGQASALKAYYVERNRLFRDLQELSAGRSAARSLLCHGAFLLARRVCVPGPGQSGRVPTAGKQPGQLPVIVVRAHWELLRRLPEIWKQRQRIKRRLSSRQFQKADPQVRDQPAPGSRIVRPAVGPNQLLVLIPAFNEEGAIAGVIREVHEVLPGVPVLVVDDASRDGTYQQARSAGADVLRLPYHLGLGGGVQAGYKLAYELGYDYVIRVDGDGQHDPKYIPDLFKTLRETGCHMVIGSRFYQNNGAHTSVVRAAGIWFFRLVLRPDSRQTGPRSDFRLRGRESRSPTGVHRQLSSGISGNRGAGRPAAQEIPVSGSALPDARS